MNADAGTLASSVQAFDRTALAVLPLINLPPGGDGDASHGVVGGRFDGNQVDGRVQIRILADGFIDLGEE